MNFLSFGQSLHSTETLHCYPNQTQDEQDMPHCLVRQKQLDRAGVFLSLSRYFLLKSAWRLRFCVVVGARTYSFTLTGSVLGCISFSPSTRAISPAHFTHSSVFALDLSLVSFESRRAQLNTSLHRPFWRQLVVQKRMKQRRLNFLRLHFLQTTPSY